ncbi:MAG: S8 family serine peptidase, partial [Saprospiraceae bacterium]
MRILLTCVLFIASLSLQAQSIVEQKGSPALQRVAAQWRQTTGSQAAENSQKMLFTLVVADFDGFTQWAQSNGWPPFLAGYAPAGVIVVEDQPGHFFASVLPRTEVLFADLGYRAGREELAVPGHNFFTNNIAWTHTRWPALDGTGSTISIKEFQFDSLDVDFKHRYLPNSGSASTSTIHASIMATLAAGAGTSDPAGRGVARGSRLVSSSFVGLLPDDDAEYDAFDIAVQNHSYGVDIENYYGAGALAYDRSTQLHSGLLHVFSAGNQGLAAAGPGAYANLTGFANLTGNFKMAKNVLVVGAVDSFGQVLAFSSRGPAYDGRLKPDLVAFGQSGTSESAALVSGSAAVVRQAFFEKYGFWPSSATVRAVLIGTADDLGAPGPDFSAGYGNLNLKNAVE